MADSDTRQRRHWADVVALVAGLWAAAESLWGPSMTATNAFNDPGSTPNWLAFAFGGALGVAGVLVAQRWRNAGRLMVALGGLALVVAPLAYLRGYSLPMISAVVCGLALLASAAFVGPMPRELHAPER